MKIVRMTTVVDEGKGNRELGIENEEKKCK
jgi:hypothetical protein